MGGSGGAMGGSGGQGGSSSSSTSSTSSSSTTSSSTSSSTSGDCTTDPPDPVTGQKCPLFRSCVGSSDCGVNTGCQLWWCNTNSKCELNALSNCGQTEGGGCSADVVVYHRYDPPVDKDFLTPDGVVFRETATMALTIFNYTTDNLYLDGIPVQLELQGGGSQFDIDALKMFEDSGGAEHQTGDTFICKTPGYPSNNVLSPCGGNSFSQVPKNGGSEDFLINIAFSATKTYIGGRSYRLKIISNQGWAFRVGSTFGPAFTGTVCGVTNFEGAWVTAVDP